MGMMGGTVLGVFAGLSVHGAGTNHYDPLLRTMMVCGAGGGTLVWLWETWHAREARRVADRIAKARERHLESTGGRGTEC